MHRTPPIAARPTSAWTLSRLIGLGLGPLAAVLLFFVLPHAVRDASGGGAIVSGLSEPGRMTIAIGAWLAVWWVTEAIPIEAAALLPLAAFPLAGVASFKAAAAPYAEEVVFLFLGGMLLGCAMERWGLHKRLALAVMLALGTSPARLLGGLLLATAIISMWVSNTAAAVMMLPIAVGVVRLTHARHVANTHDGHADHTSAHRFAIAAMLAVAYGASIGGVATMIGSPPNGVTVGFIAKTFGETITFTQWLKLGLPLMLIMLPICWGLLLLLFPTRALRVHGARELLERERQELGPMTPGEKRVLLVFAAASLAWVFREQLCHLLGLVRERPGQRPEFLLTDAGVAIIAALAMFLIPVKPRGGPWREASMLLDWKTASTIPWGVLLLFGGGLSLAAAVEANNVDDALGSLLSGLAGLPPILVLAIIAALAIFVSEIGSNTAVATVMLPIVATAAPQLGVHPIALSFTIAFGVSLAFMMPSGTPPNALVFSSGYLRVPEMVRTGLLLNLASVVVITLVVQALSGWMGWDTTPPR
jgi:solute carrier family 13 (sodium-dependent dicarboxylate transporter), member 2/3/5